jgi:hypothetical protein
LLSNFISELDLTSNPDPMKRVCVIVSVIFNFFHSLNAQTGTDCGNAISLTMDGVSRNYATSSASGTSVICTGYTGSSPVTYFSFSTNSAADKVLIEIIAPTAQPCEVLLYTNSCGTVYSSGSMCYDDGRGLWSFGHNFAIQANTTYKLRIKTTTAGNISINAKYFTPPNNTCLGATGIGATPITDNNACNSPGSGVNPGDLCASTLENTAFYKYAVIVNGVSIININNISCDNGATNNNNGFQIGFFTGSCSSLTPISCFSGSGSFVTASTVSLTAGTEVFVAIDGVSGANCKYEISVINGNVLAVSIADFIGLKTGSSNLLKWTGLQEKLGNYYEIQRSDDNREYKTIGRISSVKTSSENTDYEFEDKDPSLVSYYRIKYTDNGGQSFYSKIVLLRRGNNNGVLVELPNPVRNLLDLRLTTTSADNVEITIMNLMGQAVLTDRIKCVKGANLYTKSLSNLPAGNYYLLLRSDEIQSVTPFIKLN